MTLSIHRVYGLLGKTFRRRRMERLKRIFPEDQHPTILDLGGSDYNWRLVNYRSRITLVNLDPNTGHGGMELLIRDACKTELPPGSFSLVFSNSLIEHLSTFDHQQTLASEMQRLAAGGPLWCQTPAKWFPVEPHLIGVFIHWLPKHWQRYWMFRYCTLWGLLTKPTRRQVNDFRNEVRLLTRKECQALFPNCEIYTESLLGWPKAFIIIQCHKVNGSPAS